MSLHNQMGALCLCMGNKGRSLLFLCLILTLKLTRVECFKTGDDTLMQGDYLDESNSMSSASMSFSLSFVQIRGENQRLYLEIYEARGSIWALNQNNPIFEEKAKLVIDDYGSMKILHKNDTESIVIYASKATDKMNVSATLLNTGNLVLREMNVDGTVKQNLWESFDHPQDTLLPGMKLGFNRRTGQNWSLTSWISPKTPATGSFTLGLEMIDSNDNEQLVIRWHGSVYWISGPLTNGTFPNMNTSSRSGGNIYSIYFTRVSNENETYVTYNSTSPFEYFISLSSEGDLYGEVYVSCSNDNPERASGCVPQRFPTCRNQHAYVSMTNFRYANMTEEGYNIEDFDKLSLYDCGAKCTNDCSCFAYSSAATEDDSGCQMWHRGTKFVTTSISHGRPVYFVDEINIDNSSDSRKFKGMRKVWIASVIVGTLLVLVSFFMFHVLWRKRRLKEEEVLMQNKIICDIATPSLVDSKHTGSNKIKITNHRMHIFNFETIESATDNFSSTNKLGEGGFGTVYKGQLLDGREIAIKRLSRSSGQGLDEFKNEVKLIARFQHTNLVKLYGFCIEKEERMLIYEYMPNKSLDFHLFDSSNKTLMDWTKRFSIIQGIAQGLVYLHTYSRLTVIHRDLKPSNILLDYEMNPKISDFGLARTFDLKEPKKNTNKVVGTYGYMSPEYALNGIVSTKIDVFSFGVLMLEIISGKKNSSNYDSDHPINLIGHAWQLWNKGNTLELIDPVMKRSCAVNEVLRCIHISLLCVQDRADDRPTMSNLVSFLSSEAVLLLEPKQPTFFTNTSVNQPKNPIDGEKNHSINDVTISTMSGR